MSHKVQCHHSAGHPGS